MKNNKGRFFPSWLLFAVSLPLLLTACVTVGPDHQPPTPELPAQWSETKGTVTSGNDQTLSHWWTLFQDPRLNALIARAMAGNPDMRMAGTRIRESRAALRLAIAGGLPAIDTGLSYTTNRKGERSNDDGDTQDLFQANFDAAWEIDLFGGNRRRVAAAEASLMATVEDRRDTCVSLTAEVARNYLELRASQQRLAIARENSRTQEQTVDLVRNKFQIGLGTELEVAQAETLLAQTAAQIPGLDSAAQQAMHQLAILLGQQPHALKAELSQPGPMLPVPPHLPITLPSELLRQRPDIRSAERQLAAATATVGAATAELFPRFSLGALIGLQSSSLSELISRSSRFWTVGPAIRWNLFDAGSTRAVIETSEARRERAQLLYEKTVLTALTDTENALVALDREQTTRTHYQEAVTASQRAVLIARGQYKAGITTFLNVLQSENALYQSQDKLALSDQRLGLQMIALYKALGGGWQETLPPDSVSLSTTSSPFLVRNAP